MGSFSPTSFPRVIETGSFNPSKSLGSDGCELRSASESLGSDAKGVSQPRSLTPECPKRGRLSPLIHLGVTRKAAGGPSNHSGVSARGSAGLSNHSGVSAEGSAGPSHHSGLSGARSAALRSERVPPDRAGAHDFGSSTDLRRRSERRRPPRFGSRNPTWSLVLRPTRSLDDGEIPSSCPLAVERRGRFALGQPEPEERPKAPLRERRYARGDRRLSPGCPARRSAGEREEAQSILAPRRARGHDDPDWRRYSPRLVAAARARVEPRCSALRTTEATIGGSGHAMLAA